jgi:hypothetical protein
MGDEGTRLGVANVTAESHSDFGRPVAMLPLSNKGG